MKNTKTWYNVTVFVRDHENVPQIAWFENEKGERVPLLVMARVRSLGNAHIVANALKQVYKGDFWGVVVE